MNTTPAGWIRISGQDIEERVESGSTFDDLMDSCSAIYIWRRDYSLAQSTASSPAALLKWLHAVVEAPIALIEEQRLSHYANLGQLRIGGAELSTEKALNLKKLIATAAGRKHVAQFVRSLCQFSPPVYVGETSDLHRRARDHVSGNTELKATIMEKLGLSWTEMSMYYTRIGDARADEDDGAKARRTLLEAITTHVVFAPYVKRIG